MDNKILLERIRKWQEEPVFHQLTCAKDSQHDLLKGEVREEKVVLVCPTCHTVQTYIPDIFFTDGFDEAYDQQKKMLDLLQ